MSQARRTIRHTVPFADEDVARVFAAYPDEPRARLLELRALIYAAAEADPRVGELQETLKWGEPAYLTPHSRSGSTIRLGWKPRDPEHYALYFNCQTTLVETFRTLFPRDFACEGNRAIRFPVRAALPRDAVSFCIAAALTYHLDKRARG